MRKLSRPALLTAACLFLLAVLMMCVKPLVPSAAAAVSPETAVQVNVPVAASGTDAGQTAASGEVAESANTLAEVSADLPELLAQTPLWRWTAVLPVAPVALHAPVLTLPFAERPQRPPRLNTHTSRLA